MTPNQWYRRKMSALRAERGNKCEHCSTPLQVSKDRPNLQWAHLTPTELRGEGRGRNRRIQDIIRNPRAYALLCAQCHTDLDTQAAPEPAPMLMESL